MTATAPTTHYNYTYHTSSMGVSREARFVESNRLKREADFLGRSISTREVILNSNKNYFNLLKENWLKETMLSSDPNEIYQNSNYQKIIALGDKAVPLIFEDWKNSNNHWFHALNTITGKNPVRPENRGRVKLMKKDWIDFLNLD